MSLSATASASNPTYSPINDDEFKLAITMAGAASAGCYTGGVMDYLFEILDLWERVKDDIENKKNGLPLKAPELKAFWEFIPQHKVTIDAMGGTSAGGMTSVMAAIYALNGNIKPVKKPGKTKESKDNIFYDSWVVMDDLNPNDDRDTAEKLFDTDDLDDNLVHSFLNSKFIDNIADRCFVYKHDPKTQASNLPGYISKDLQLILSHCLLRGIPLNVSFETKIGSVGHKSILPDHTTYEHYIVSHYHLNKGIAPKKDQYFWLNPYDEPHAGMLRLATKATGAFPAGLVYREFDMSNFENSILRTSIKRMITDKLGIADPDPLNEIKLKYLAKNYSTISVDGGAINNEPYREVNCLLKDKYGPVPPDNFPRHGVVMIDPFPDKGSLNDEYTKPADLFQVVPSIIGSLVDQSRVKRRELLESDSNSSFRSIIFPRKWKKIREEALDNVEEEAAENEEQIDDFNVRPDTKPLACAAAMAFGGLLDIKFREHDFFLGRNNARNFIRYFFSFPYDDDPEKRHPIHKNWSNEMINKFMIKKKVKKKENGKPVETEERFLPIIPDLTFLTEKETDIGARRFEFDIPEIPPYDPERLFALQPAIKKRFLKMINTLPFRGKVLGKLKKETTQKKLQDLYIKLTKAEEKLNELNEMPPSPQNEKTIKNKNASITLLENQKRLLEQELAGVIPTTNAGNWIKKEYKKGIISKHIIGPLSYGIMALIFFALRGMIANEAAKSAIKKVLADLDSNRCLKQMPSKD